MTKNKDPVSKPLPWRKLFISCVASVIAWYMVALLTNDEKILLWLIMYTTSTCLLFVLWQNWSQNNLNKLFGFAKWAYDSLYEKFFKRSEDEKQSSNSGSSDQSEHNSDGP